MIKITEDQWAIYRERYEKLIWTIARKISGDEMTAGFDDNVADLTIAAMGSIDAYCRKENFTVDQAFEDPGFDKYTKTVLWNYKCKKGVPLTKRMPFRNKHVSIDAMSNTDDGQSFDIEDKQLSTSSSFVLDDMFRNIDFDAQKIIKAIIEDPNVLSPDGALRLASLTKPTGLSIHSVRSGVGKIKRILEKTYARD